MVVGLWWLVYGDEVLNAPYSNFHTLGFKTPSAAATRRDDYVGFGEVLTLV